MIKTDNAYINEYKLFDLVLEGCEEFEEEVLEATFEYNREIDKIDLETFFEAEGNTDEKATAAKQSFLNKIGTAIMKLVEKVANLINDIKEKILGNTKSLESDVEIVNRMLKDHPELAEKVVDGINKEWFTYADLAQYEKDVVGLITLLKESKLDHETFLEKMSKLNASVGEESKNLGNTLKTADQIINFIPTMSKKWGDMRTDYGRAQDYLKKTAKDIMKNHQGMSTQQAKDVAKACNDVLANMTREARRQTYNSNKISAAFSSLAKWFDKL